MNATPNSAAGLRARAEALAGHLPPLLAAAEHLAASIVLGEHGRKRAGMGDQFWQYRPAAPGDHYRDIDWRRSGRADAHFVRQKEWQAEQSVSFWVDDAQSMEFSGAKGRVSKADRARLLALAAMALLVRGGERVGLMGRAERPRSGRAQLERIAVSLTAPARETDYGAPHPQLLLAGSRAVFLSDFLGPQAEVQAALTQAADRGIKGALLQVLDPAEEAFPYDGRTRFESMAGTVKFETLKARNLREEYLARLAARKDELASLARRTGWQYHCHHTDQVPNSALLWLYQALEGVA